MGLFDKIGVDWKMLIAQMINFAVLLLILKHFLYKPIIARIEKDEATLKEAETKKEAVEALEAKAKKERNALISTAQKRSQEIVHEAEQIAADFEKTQKQKAQARADKLVTMAKNQARSLSRKEQHALEKDAKERFLTTLTDSLSGLLTEDTTGEAVDTIFFEQLLTEVKHLLKSSGDTSGVAMIESANTLTADQRQRLKDVLGENEITLHHRRNKHLICGYRFELNGSVIEENLRNEFEYAKENA